ncbi:zinc finger BED domain-containing protein 5-like [Aphis gossypii]|uniref:zinc finger BED domain-containing protein 5-like n=1 Tax=Aphis gossypii TaxID=80765 RepID=UPI002159076F|nr:zinc finger BED domain-containing protein 5-like [Aphis gossypii]
MLSYRIARAGKPHTIAEDLIKPCMTEIVNCVLGEDAAKKITAVQCSNNVISDRIHKISDHIHDELICRLKNSKMFAIQLDESTDVAGLSILLVFVRHPFKGSIEEDLFLCAPLETNTTGEEIFKVIDSHMSKHHIEWNKCIDVCSDGAAAMIGKIKGTVTRIKSVAPKCSNSHCVLHRPALVAMKISYELKTILDQALQIVNYVKSRPLQSRLFKKVCEDIEKYENLIDIKCSSSLKQKFGAENFDLNNFWIGLQDEYPTIVEKAITILLPFVTTYRCETGFSAYAYTKNKYRNRLDASPDIRIQLSDIKPNFTGNTALRGNEGKSTSTSMNEDNFIPSVRLMAEFDPILHHLLYTEKTRVKYLSWKIQNDYQQT